MTILRQLILPWCFLHFVRNMDEIETSHTHTVVHIFQFLSFSPRSSFVRPGKMKMFTREFEIANADSPRRNNERLQGNERHKKDNTFPRGCGINAIRVILQVRDLPHVIVRCNITYIHTLTSSTSLMRNLNLRYDYDFVIIIMTSTNRVIVSWQLASPGPLHATSTQERICTYNDFKAKS